MATTEFLRRLASQLKVNKQPAERRAVEKLLHVVAEKYEVGLYANPCDAERDLRVLVDEACNEFLKCGAPVAARSTQPEPLGKRNRYA
jgi:hypothetical protein